MSLGRCSWIKTKNFPSRIWRTSLTLTSIFSWIWTSCKRRTTSCFPICFKICRIRAFLVTPTLNSIHQMVTLDSTLTVIHHNKKFLQCYKTRSKWWAPRSSWSLRSLRYSSRRTTVRAQRWTMRSSSSFTESMEPSRICYRTSKRITKTQINPVPSTNFLSLRTFLIPWSESKLCTSTPSRRLQHLTSTLKAPFLVSISSSCKTRILGSSRDNRCSSNRCLLFSNNHKSSASNRTSSHLFKRSRELIKETGFKTTSNCSSRSINSNRMFNLNSSKSIWATNKS